MLLEILSTAAQLTAVGKITFERLVVTVVIAGRANKVSKRGTKTIISVKGEAVELPPHSSPLSTVTIVILHTIWSVDVGVAKG